MKTRVRRTRGVVDPLAAPAMPGFLGGLVFSTLLWLAERMRQHLASLFTALALLVLVAPGIAETYLPLDVGCEWHYANDLGQLEDMSITGQRELLGVWTAVRHEEIHDGRIPPQIIDNFWTSNADGDLLLHGAVNHTDTMAVAYWPPVLMVDGPLFAGKSWTTEGVRMYDLEGNPLGPEPFDYPLAVHTAGEVEVPAGVFFCFGVGFDPALPIIRTASGRAFDVRGRRVPAWPSPLDGEATDWYSSGIGVVQYSYLTTPGEMLKLTSWQPASIARASWGRIKALYMASSVD